MAARTAPTTPGGALSARQTDLDAVADENPLASRPAAATAAAAAAAGAPLTSVAAVPQPAAPGALLSSVAAAGPIPSRSAASAQALESLKTRMSQLQGAFQSTLKGGSAAAGAGGGGAAATAAAAAAAGAAKPAGGGGSALDSLRARMAQGQGLGGGGAQQ